MQDQIFSLEAALKRGQPADQAPQDMPGSEPVVVLIADEDAKRAHHFIAALRDLLPSVVCTHVTDSEEVLDSVAESMPDLLLLRTDLPGMGGLQLTRALMARHPVPVVITAEADSDEIETAFDCLRSGALDIVESPARGKALSRGVAERLLALIRTLRTPLPPAEQKTGAVSQTVSTPAVLTLISGPGDLGAVLRLLGELPPLTVPCLLLTTIAPPFFPAFMRWLDTVLPDGAVAAAARDLSAPSEGQLMVFSGATLGFITPEGHLNILADSGGSSPADFLLSSMARSLRGSCAAVLTGHTGKSGATGLLELHQAGAATFAEEPALCPFAQAPAQVISADGVGFYGNLMDIADRLEALLPAKAG